MTNAARPKNDSAIVRIAARSRVCGSGAENCHATAAADSTSTTESSPKPISAEDEASRPATSATPASTTL